MTSSAKSGEGQKDTEATFLEVGCPCGAVRIKVRIDMLRPPTVPVLIETVLKYAQSLGTLVCPCGMVAIVDGPEYWWVCKGCGWKGKWEECGTNTPGETQCPKCGDECWSEGKRG